MVVSRIRQMKILYAFNLLLFLATLAKTYSQNKVTDFSKIESISEAKYHNDNLS